ncbi:MAG: hypothetical protein JSU86_08650, partial [Phycisphaerales bacterium]
MDEETEVLNVGLLRACAGAVVLAGIMLPAAGHGAMWSKTPNHNEAEGEFIAVRDAYLAKFRPLYVESRRTSWEASVTGTDAAFDRQR